ncbi:MAG: hypothetical protein QGI34_20905 [Candidatus Latescibacteria bacterium]|nr:hypothetical protein [Candidatus Latescibacterota bacterium]
MGGPGNRQFFIRSTENVGTRVALLYFINSFGVVAGTLIAGFYVVEQLGLIVGLLATGSVHIILGLLILIMDRGLAQRTPEDTVSVDGLNG